MKTRGGIFVRERIDAEASEAIVQGAFRKVNREQQKLKSISNAILLNFRKARLSSQTSCGALSARREKLMRMWQR